MPILPMSLTLLAAVSAVSAGTERPVIGVLAQEASDSIQHLFPELNYTAYIASSYVKFVEGAGARVAPVLIRQPPGYYERLFTELNGLLLPGGNADLDGDGYAAAARVFWQLAHDHPERYFPIWGTCQGHEQLAVIAAGANIVTLCEGENQTATVQLDPTELPHSRIFANASHAILDLFELEPNLAMNHRNCVLSDALDSTLRAVGSSRDLAGVSYVSVFEHRQLPIYGVQFHPEKALFEWSPPSAQISHSAHAIAATQYLADFLVGEARRSDNSFEDPAEEQAALIYNYQARYSAARGSSLEQIYVFQ